MRRGFADRLADGLAFVAAQIVEHDDIAGRQRREQGLLDIGPERFAIDRLVEHDRSGDPVVAECCDEGRVRQRPCGTSATRRSPRSDRPWVLVMLVFAQVSSMNTRRRGSSLCLWCRQRSRLRATSGRSCSAACRLFFERHSRLSVKRQTAS